MQGPGYVRIWRHSWQCRLLVTALVVALGGAAHAIPIDGTDASGELIGFRNVDPGGGLLGFGQYVSNPPNDPFRVSWEIDLAAGPGTVHYKYTFTGLDVSGQEREISNFAIEISANCASDPLCVTDPTVNGVAVDMSSVEFGAINGITYAVKIDVGGAEGVMYEFDSNRLPVYGDLAIKDGGGSGTCPNPGSTTAACSNALVLGFDTGDPNDFVARPNGIVPEPATGALLAAGVLGLAARRRR